MLQSQYQGVFLWLTISASTVILCKLKFFLDHSEYPSSGRLQQQLQQQQQKSKKAAAIPRSDSEFSIGLGRSNSVEKHLGELGTLCDSGLYVISLSRKAAISIVLCTGAYLTYKRIVYPSN